MEPRIQYAKTKDGVNIAFWALGEGTPFVTMNDIPFSHIQLESQYGFQALYDKLAAKRKFIRFDPRGMGMSDREVERFSLDLWLNDLEAVVDRLGLETFVLLGVNFSGPLAIAYAARQQKRVSRLILMNTGARVADGMAAPQVQLLADMMVRDWEMFSENVGALVFGWGREDAATYGEFVRASTTPDAARHAFAALSTIDVTELLPRVTVPTLVIRHSGVKVVTEAMTKGLVAGIPDARLAVFEGAYSLNWERMVSAVEEFLDEGEEPETETLPAEAGTFRTVLFTDVEGSTALTDRLGDAKARELLREHERMVREALRAHGGSEVKALGDGFMTSFSSATRALECAIAMQRGFAQRNESAEEPIEVRIGLNAGEPIAEDDDLYGTAVNLAARIAAQAEGGEILASEAVRQIVAGKKFPFSDRGETTLRGFEDRVHIYQVSWRGEE
jgi:class 3 adenylate cyclase